MVIKTYFVFVMIFLFLKNNAIATENTLCDSIQTQDLIQCLVKEGDRLDEELNNLYGKLREKLDNKSFNQLKKVQILWLNTYKTWCDLEYPDVDAGAEISIYYNICINQQIKERNRELLYMISILNNDKRGSNVVEEDAMESINTKLYQEKFLNFHCKFMKANFGDANCISRNIKLHITNFG